MKKRRKNNQVRSGTARQGKALLCLSLTATLCVSAFSVGSIVFAGPLYPEEMPAPTETVSAGNVSATAWIVVVAAASCCLILMAADRRIKSKKGFR